MRCTNTSFKCNLITGDSHPLGLLALELRRAWRLLGALVVASYLLLLSAPVFRQQGLLLVLLLHFGSCRSIRRLTYQRGGLLAGNRAALFLGPTFDETARRILLRESWCIHDLWIVVGQGSLLGRVAGVSIFRLHSHSSCVVVPVGVVFTQGWVPTLNQMVLGTLCTMRSRATCADVSVHNVRSLNHHLLVSRRGLW